ncbi:ROK family protein [Acidipropionibacterium timonense]|uniref:ROK family protein n=1 Tax=Acidipropionibacterium timonense TaxID=2161818 RepID=UPI001FD99C16|nr:ROK family protein [Acidipropionibacterium timonense]
MVGIIDGGATGAHLALVSADQRLLASMEVTQGVCAGPERTLQAYIDAMNSMISGLKTPLPLVKVVIGLPARIDTDTSLPVRPTIMPGWDAFPVAGVLEDAWGADVLVENDVNLRCVGEACWGPVEWLPILAIKVGTGIGAGLIDKYGHIYHGYRGAAGEIGHMPARGASPDLVCTCGAVGCVEANASIHAMLVKLSREASSDSVRRGMTLPELLENVRNQDRATMEVVADAADTLGDAVAVLCNVLNPRRVMITCALSEVTDDYLARIRSEVYKKARPLASREVIIGYSPLGSNVGVAGGIALALDDGLSILARRALQNPWNG